MHCKVPLILSRFANNALLGEGVRVRVRVRVKPLMANLDIPRKVNLTVFSTLLSYTVGLH